MAIIVEHKTTKEKYYLLGTGLGMYKAISPSFFGGMMFPREEEGCVQSIGVCDGKGEIFFIDSNALRVVSIDGNILEEIQDDIGRDMNDDDEYCPACGGLITTRTLECPHCGLVYGA